MEHRTVNITKWFNHFNNLLGTTRFISNYVRGCDQMFSFLLSLPPSITTMGPKALFPIVSTYSATLCYNFHCFFSLFPDIFFPFNSVPSFQHKFFSHQKCLPPALTTSLRSNSLRSRLYWENLVERASHQHIVLVFFLLDVDGSVTNDGIVRIFGATTALWAACHTQHRLNPWFTTRAATGL